MAQILNSGKILSRIALKVYGNMGHGTVGVDEVRRERWPTGQNAHIYQVRIQRSNSVLHIAFFETIEEAADFAWELANISGLIS